MCRLCARYSLPIATLLLLAACGGKSKVAPTQVPEPEPLPSMADLRVAGDFDYATTQSVQVAVRILDPQGQTMPYLRVDLYQRDGEGVLQPLASGATDESGGYAAELSLAAHVDSLVVEVDCIGIMPGQVSVPIVGGRVEHVFGGTALQRPPRAKPIGAGSAAGKPTAAMGGLTYMGNWDGDGVPDYLEAQGDPIDGALLRQLNASLPERRSVPVNNPQFLTARQTNTRVTEAADVWVTFVHEGALWKNALGFYTYPVGQPPTQASQIRERRVIFPNVSAVGSGGRLYPGDRVHLGRFPAGTEIGWFLAVQGWRGSSVTEGTHIVYSDPGLNPERDPRQRQHSVLLSVPDRQMLLLGFEDLRRDETCDEDFNDAVFYVTVTPYSSVETRELAESRVYIDSDGDHIEDYCDEYPHDPTRAFNSWCPGRGAYATLAFEDGWPAKGDYDFNDLVVAYNFAQISNAANRVVALDGTFRVKAAGASFLNGMGVQLPLSPSQVRSVEGAHLTERFIATGANGVESGQSRAVIVVFDNAYTVVRPPAGYYLNTQREAPRVEPAAVSIHVELASPATLSETAPFNPFAIINRTRGKEVHLPGRNPTDLADPALFGTGDDRSTAMGYYRSAANLPWALNLATAWRHPVERAPIVQAYRYFASWAESSGRVHADWFLDQAGQVDAALVYPAVN